MTHQIIHLMKSFTLLAICLLAYVCEANADPIQIVAFGTSFTNGKGVWRSEAFPARLETMLKSEGEDVRVTNQGVNGNTTIDLLGRLDKAVPKGVDIVILEYALGNDKKIGGISEENTVNNVEKIISQLRARNIQVLLLIRAGNQRNLEERITWLREIIAKYDILFLPIKQPLTSLLSDRQHPTAISHELIAESMVAPVKKLIARAKAAGT